MGSTRTLATYESSSDTLLGTLRLEPVDGLEIGLDAVWSQSDAGFRPFELMVPDDYLARNPNQSYDFSRTHTYSDLDVSRLELGLGVRYLVGDRMALRAGYRFVDFDDDAPYLEDTTGRIEYYNLGVGWSF